MSGLHVRFAFFLLICLLVSPACHHRSGPVSSSTNSKWLRWTIDREPHSLDWTFCEDQVCLNQVPLLMEGLTHPEGAIGARKAQPSLAESWKWENPSRLVFTLRSNVRWSDGEPLRASHFSLAWKRLLRNCRRTSQAERLFPIVNARAFCEGKKPFSQVGIRVTDPVTLAIEFRTPQPGFPLIVTDPSTWPVRFESGVSATAEALPVVLGPFLLEKWAHGSELRFIRNPHYYRGPPPVAGVEARIVPSAHLRVQLFLDRESDLVDEIPSAVAFQLKGNPDLLAAPTGSTVALIFNTAKRPFQLPAVRQAFARSIRREELVSLLHLPHLLTDELVPSPLPSPPARVPLFSVPAAVQLLTNAQCDLTGMRYWEGGQWRPLPRLTLAPTSGELGREVAENLQAQWLKNLEVKVEVVPASAPNPSMWIEPVAAAVPQDTRSLEAIVQRAHWKNHALDAILAARPDANDTAALTNPVEELESLLVTKEAIALPLFLQTRPVLRRAIARIILQGNTEM